MRSLVRFSSNFRLRSATKWVIVAVIAVGLITAFLWYVPERQVRSFPQYDQLEAKDVLVQTNEYRRTWAQIIAGFVVLLGLYFTWRRVEISQEQQVTERFTRAIDQLGATDDKGNKKLEIRLGGIYALERIARDSERDHWPIMETLTTYVQEHAPWPPKTTTHETGFVPPPRAEKRHQQTSTEPDGNTSPGTHSVPGADILAILTILRRRTRYLGNGEVEHLDLHETDLRGGNLSEANLMGAYLSEAHLERANLSGANLEEAFLARANLGGAYLSGANLETAGDLTEEQIEQAAIGDGTTKLPEGIKMPKSWAREASGQTEEDE